MKLQFHHFPERNNFRFNISTNFDFSECGENQPTSLPWNVVFIGANRFALSIIVFEKMDVKFGVRFRPTFKFYAAVVFDVKTLDKVVSKN